MNATVTSAVSKRDSKARPVHGKKNRKMNLSLAGLELYVKTRKLRIGSTTARISGKVGIGKLRLVAFTAA